MSDPLLDPELVSQLESLGIAAEYEDAFGDPYRLDRPMQLVVAERQAGGQPAGRSRARARSTPGPSVRSTPSRS